MLMWEQHVTSCYARQSIESDESTQVITSTGGAILISVCLFICFYAKR